MVEITVLGPGDHATLRDVLPDVFDLPLRDDLVREFLEDPRHHLAVSLHDGRVVGFASAIHYVHPDKGPELWINEVGVASAHRREGLGRQLVGALLRLAADIGCREAWVLTERENTAAMRLYESMEGVQPPTTPVMFSFAVGSARDRAPAAGRTG